MNSTMEKRTIIDSEWQKKKKTIDENKTSYILIESHPYMHFYRVLCTHTCIKILA